jgi:hypothetical protein
MTHLGYGWVWTRSTNENLDLLIKTDSLIVISIWGHTQTQTEILSYTEILGKARLLSLFKSVFLAMSALP